jgi:hypothetical protein
MWNGAFLGNACHLLLVDSVSFSIYLWCLKDWSIESSHVDTQANHAQGNKVTYEDMQLTHGKQSPGQHDMQPMYRNQSRQQDTYGNDSQPCAAHMEIKSAQQASAYKKEKHEIRNQARYQEFINLPRILVLIPY